MTAEGVEISRSPAVVEQFRVIAEELKQQCVHLFWLLLLNPMPGAIEEMESDHMCACGVAHLVDRARRLVDAPVAFACDELRGHVDGTTRESVHLRNASG